MPGTQLAQQQQQQDFQIPQPAQDAVRRALENALGGQQQPQQQGQPVPQQLPGQAPVPQGQQTGTGIPEGFEQFGDVAGTVAQIRMTDTQIIASAAIVAVLAIVFYVFKRMLTGYLIASRCAPSASGRAGWTLWTFLFFLGLTVTLAIVGGLLNFILFMLPLGILTLINLIFFLIMYFGARRTRR